MTDPTSSDNEQRPAEAQEVPEAVQREIEEAARLPDPTKWQTYGRPGKQKDA
jgi:hypothetical protein